MKEKSRYASALTAIVIIIVLAAALLAVFLVLNGSAPQNPSPSTSNSTLLRCGAGNSCISSAELFSLIGSKSSATASYHVAFSRNVSFSSDNQTASAPGENATVVWSVWADYDPNALATGIGNSAATSNQAAYLSLQPVEYVYLSGDAKSLYLTFLNRELSGMRLYTQYNISTAPAILNGTVNGLTYTYILNRDFISKESLSTLIGYKGNEAVFFSYLGGNIINQTALADTLAGDLT